jgi:multidrug efflux pump subunit AcrA (membrane-fusion protein)
MRHQREFISVCALGIVVLLACGRRIEEIRPVVKDVVEVVFAPGVLEADNLYHLKAQTEGYLTELNFEEGEIVGPGKVMAIINNRESKANAYVARELRELARKNTLPQSPQLTQTRISLESARTNFVRDSTQWTRYARLIENQSVSRTDYEAAELQMKTSLNNYRQLQQQLKQQEVQAQESLWSNEKIYQVAQVQSNYGQLVSPIGGKVYKRHKTLGDFVQKGEIIAEIGNASLVYANIQVDESNIASIRVGQLAYVRLNTQPDTRYSGVIDRVDPGFDEETQSYKCRVLFTDSLNFRIIGTQLQCNVVIDTQYQALLIPRKFIDYGNRVRIKGVDSPVVVKTKSTGSEWVQVVSGIDVQTVLVADK